MFAFHGSMQFDAQDSGFLPVGIQHWLAQLGFFGVAVFFVISGFLLFRPFAVAALESRPAPRVLQFWKRRIFRIFPAYWVAVAVVVYILGQSTLSSTGQVVTAFGLFQNYRNRYQSLGLDVAWTLVIEVSFYFALPILAWLIRAVSDRSPDLRFKVRVHLVALAVLAAVALAVRYWAHFEATFGAQPRGAWFAPVSVTSWLIAYLDWFALGMALAVGSAWLSVGGRISKVIATLGRMPTLSWLLALECYWLVVQLGLGSFANASPGSATQLYLRWIFMGLAGAFFVLPAVFGPQRNHGLRRVLLARPLVMLGVISYGIYLWHLPVWLQAREWLPTGLPMVLQLAIVLAATVAIAIASWEVVERPIISWSTGRTVSLWKGHTTVPVGAADPDTTRSSAHLAVAAIVVLVALVGLTIGSMDLVEHNVTGAPDPYVWRTERSAVWDDFDRPNQAGLGTTVTGQQWESLSGDWRIADRRAVVDRPGFAIVRIPVSHLRATGGGIAFRCADAQNCWWIDPIPSFLTWNIHKIVNGKITYVGNLGFVTTKPDAAIGVHLVGDQITISVEGRLATTINDPELRDAVGVGLARGVEGSPRWRSFEATR